MRKTNKLPGVTSDLCLRVFFKVESQKVEPSHTLSQVTHSLKSQTLSSHTLSRVTHSLKSLTLSSPTLSQVIHSLKSCTLSSHTLSQVSHSLESHTLSSHTLFQVLHSLKSYTLSSHTLSQSETISIGAFSSSVTSATRPTRLSWVRREWIASRSLHAEHPSDSTAALYAS